jgi:hypothetical protein
MKTLHIPLFLVLVVVAGRAFNACYALANISLPTGLTSIVKE